MSIPNKSVKKSKLNITGKADLSEIIFLLLIVGLVPLIVASKLITLSDIERIYLGDDPKLDVSSYYKMVALLIFTTAGFLVCLVKRSGNFLEKNKLVYYIPVGIYMVFTFLSAAASQYKQIAFWGFFERYEGLFVFVAYIVIFLLAMNFINEEKQIRLLLICLLISCTIICIIGILQYFYINPIKVFAAVTMPRNAIIKHEPGPNNVYSTLYNRNYVGSYTAMLLPIAIICFVWAKKILYRIVLAVLLCLITVTWILCDSRAGIVGGIAAVLVILVMYRKKLLRHKLIIASIAALLCGGLVIVNFATNGSVVDKIERITSITSKDSSAQNAAAFESVIKGLEDISMNRDRARIVTSNGTLQVVLLDNGEIKLVDENNEQLDFDMDNNMITLNDDRFRNIKLENISKDGTMIVYYNDYKLIDIIFTDNGLMSSYNRWMSYRDDKAIERFGFEGMESYGSNRGYIWSRTIPLIKDTILLGHGPDTFPMYFPQYDFVSKLRYYQEGGILVDKPHNFYLQTAVNTGVVSLIALLVLFGTYIIASIKLYINEEFYDFKTIAGLACFAAFIGYAVSGLFNDSVISVAPVFWILFGSGIGINISLFNYKNKSIKKGKVKASATR